MRNFRTAAIAIVAAIAVLGRAAAAQAPDSSFDRGVLDVRIGSGLSASMPAFLNSHGAALLPVERVLNLTGLTAMAGSSDSVRLVPMLNSTVPAALDLRKRIVQRRDIKSPIASDEIVLFGGEWYLASDRLAELLGARISVDIGGLVVAIMRTPPFPAEQLHASKDPGARYDAGLSDRGLAYQTPLLRRTGGIAADWQLSASGSGASSTTAIRSELGFSVEGGAVSAAVGASRDGFDHEALASSWQYQWVTTSTPFLRSVIVGNSGTGTTGRAIRGVNITNVQPFHTGLFSVIGIVPDAPPGWSYEVYRGGRLLGFSNGTQRVPVQIPMDYGSTPIEIRYLGPAGEEIRKTYTYQVPAQQVAPGRVDYSVGGGECAGVSDCRLAFGNAAVGLRPWLTIGGGTDALDSAGHHSVQPVGRMLAALPAGVTAHADWTSLQTSTGFSYFGVGRINGGLEAGVVRNPSAVATYTSGGRQVFVEPTLSVGILSTGGIATHTLRLAARIERGGQTDSTVGRTHLSSSIDVPRGRLTLDYDRDITTPNGQVTLGEMFVTPRALPLHLGALPLTGSLGIEQTSLHLVTLGGALFSDDRRSLGLDARWSAGGLGDARRGMTISLNYSAILGGLHQTMSANAAPGGAPNANLVVGSLAIYDPGVGFESLARAGINTSGIAGLVYYDNDGDGKFSPGDTPASGIVVHADGFTATTDANGRYTIWGVTAFEPVHVGVDTIQVADGGFIATDPERAVRLSPNLFTRFNLSLSRTREVGGNVEVDTTVSTQAGITIELKDTKRNRSYSSVTFADGGYYLDRVLPGHYEVAVSPSSLAALQAVQVAPVFIDVKAVGDGPVMAPPIRITKARAVGKN